MKIEPRTFIVADPDFFNVRLATNYNLSVEEYNSTIVNNMLSCAGAEDFFLFFGDLTRGTLEQTIEVLKPLCPLETCILVDTREQVSFSQEDYKKIFRHTWNAPGCTHYWRKGKRYTILLSPTLENLKADINSAKKQEETYVITTSSKWSELNYLYKNRVLNASIHYNNLFPLAFDEVPTIINREESKEKTIEVT